MLNFCQPGLDKIIGVVYHIYTMKREYKMIRLDPEVYNELELFRLKRETFSGAIFRLLCLHGQLSRMLENLAGPVVEPDHETIILPGKGGK